MNGDVSQPQEAVLGDADMRWRMGFEQAVQESVELHAIAFEALAQRLGPETAVRLADPLVGRIVDTATQAAYALEQQQQQEALELRRAAWQQAVEAPMGVMVVQRGARPW